MQNIVTYFWGRHKTVLAVLCLLVLSVRAQRPIQASGSRIVPVDTSEVRNTSEVRSDSGRVKLVYADSLVRRENREYLIFKGNVCFRRDSMFMYCDSLYFYNKKNMFDAFGNVRMEQGDTLFVYGDVLYYNGDTQLARLRENVRMINRDVTLYTDSLNYDQQINIGYYFDGGRIVDAQNELTSTYGQYSPDTKDAVFQESVVLTNDRFVLYSDTLEYNTATKIADIIGPSTITSDSNIIYSDLGWYNTQENTATLYNQSTIVSKERSLSGDTIYYDRNSGYGEVFGNMFLDDTIRKVIMTGQYGFYNEITEYAFVTDSAMAIEYSGVDSLFLHGDTLKSYNDTIPKKLLKRDLTLKNNIQKQVDSVVVAADSLALALGDTLSSRIDSSVIQRRIVEMSKSNNDTIPTHIQRRNIPLEGNVQKRIDQALVAVDSLVLAMGDTLSGQLDSTVVEKEKTLRLAGVDSAAVHQITGNMAEHPLPLSGDSLNIPDSLANVSLLASQPEVSEDTVTRLLEAYHNVRFFRNQSQGVCDSMVFVMADSVLTMYKDPILWNAKYQLFGRVIDIYLSNENIDWVHLPESAFGAQEKDTASYDQMTGKEMKAFFRNGEAYKIDVIGNVETIYYPLEKDSSILYQNKTVSSSLTMLLENQRMNQIKFYQKPDMVVTPIDQLKSDMKYLKDFKWFAELRPKDKWDIFRKISKKEEDKDTQKNRFQLDDWQ